VRRFVGIGPQGRPLFSDLLGELVARSAERLVVRTPDGAEHAIAVAEVAAAKRVPPRTPKYSEIARLELVADEAWPAPVREHLGEWILRAADGFTNRANSVLPIGDPGRPLDAAVDAGEAWYRDRGLAPRIITPLPLRRDLNRLLDARGWHTLTPVHVQTASLAGVVAAVEPTQAVTLREEPSEELLALIARRKSSLPAAARHLLTAVRQVRFAQVYAAGGQLAAAARGAIVGDGEWLHVGLVEVVEAHRRRGLAQQVTRALAAWASELGARTALLQVDAANDPAMRLYHRLGFTTHHDYVTHWLPAR
jgi:ribosomal protein S18 acetylase RimI-like enzyme